jgi:hypothetical protein
MSDCKGFMWPFVIVAGGGALWGLWATQRETKRKG